MPNDLITVFLASTIVSSIISFILKISAENKIKHHFNVEIENLRHSFDIELEKLKSSMIVEVDTAHELLERRFDLYPDIITLLYRIKNISRELSSSSEPSPAFIDELEARKGELEETLYKFRMDLERDGFFGPIHAYKNNIKSFIRLIKDCDLYREAGDNEEMRNISDSIKKVYEDIENDQNLIIKLLVDYVDNPPLDKKAGKLK